MHRRVLLALPLFLVACSGDTTRNAKMLVGNWNGSQWLADGKPSENDPKATSFRFEADGNYTYTYAGTAERGLYHIDDDKLFTRPQGQEEIMVRIAKLTNDSLQFEMNRGGRAELLTLLRK